MPTVKTNISETILRALLNAAKSPDRAAPEVIEAGDQLIARCEKQAQINQDPGTEWKANPNFPCELNIWFPTLHQWQVVTFPTPAARELVLEMITDQKNLEHEVETLRRRAENQRKEIALLTKRNSEAKKALGD